MGEEEYCDGVGYQVVQGHGVGGGGAGRRVHSLLCHPLEVSGPFITLFPRNQKTFEIFHWMYPVGVNTPRILESLVVHNI